MKIGRFLEIHGDGIELAEPKMKRREKEEVLGVVPEDLRLLWSVYLAIRDRQTELGTAFQDPNTILTTKSPEALEVYENTTLLFALKNLFWGRVQFFIDNYMDSLDLRQGWEIVKVDERLLGTPLVSEGAFRPN